MPGDTPLEVEADEEEPQHGDEEFRHGEEAHHEGVGGEDLRYPVGGPVDGGVTAAEGGEGGELAGLDGEHAEAFEDDDGVHEVGGSHVGLVEAGGVFVAA